MKTPISQSQLPVRIAINAVFILASVILTMMFTMPKLDEVNAQAKETNAVISKFESIQKNGIPFSELESSIKQTGNNSELLDLVKTSPEETKKAIVKEGDEPYMAWLSTASTKNAEDKLKLQKAKARINTIVPTLSPINGNIEEQNITLRDYITFIEQNILANFNIKSLSPLGMSSIVYEKEKEEENEDKNAPKKPLNPIGYFLVDLNFESTNKNISELLDFIHTIGNPEILSSKDIHKEIPPVMSNPLITVDAIALDQILDPQSPSKANSGRITLKFFVRGSSPSDSTFLVEAFNKQRDELEKNISEKLAQCEKDPATCAHINAIQKLNTRFQRFKQSFAKTLSENQNNSIEIVYLVAEQLPTLKVLKDEFSKLQ